MMLLLLDTIGHTMIDMNVGLLLLCMIARIMIAVMIVATTAVMIVALLLTIDTTLHPAATRHLEIVCMMIEIDDHLLLVITNAIHMAVVVDDQPRIDYFSLNFQEISTSPCYYSRLDLLSPPFYSLVSSTYSQAKALFCSIEQYN